jgi:heat shock protein HtpX
MTLYQQQTKNIRKAWALVLIFALVVIGLGWFFSYYYDDSTVLYFAVGFALLMNVGSYWFSSSIVTTIAGAKKADPVQHKEIHNLLENLCISQGMQKPELYIINDPAPNAFATGRNEKHSVVAVTTGLLQLLDRTELEGVLAHELAHIKNKDILIGSMVIVLVGFIAILSDIFLRAQFFSGGSSDRDSKAGMIIAVAGIALAVLSPIIAKLIQLAISRKREFLADASGALMTRYPEGLASALQKIDTYAQTRGGELKRANHAMAHLYIANPFGAKAKKTWNRLWSTHPQTEDRVSALLKSQQM